MNLPQNALLLAAGRGTRISSVSKEQPKVLLEIAGKPVLFHNLELLAKHGIKNVWINLHHQAELIQNAVKGGAAWGLNVQYSFEKEILGTAGAVKNLEKELSGSDFMVLYGDNYTDCDLMKLYLSHKQSSALGTVALFDQGKSKNSGIAGGRVVTDEQGFIQKFTEGGTAESQLVNGGIYAFGPSVLKDIPNGFSDFGKDIFPALLAQGKQLFSFLIDGFCFGIDTPQAYEKAKNL